MDYKERLEALKKLGEDSQNNPLLKYSDNELEQELKRRGYLTIAPMPDFDIDLT